MEQLNEAHRFLESGKDFDEDLEVFLGAPNVGYIYLIEGGNMELSAQKVGKP